MGRLCQTGTGKHSHEVYTKLLDSVFSTLPKNKEFFKFWNSHKTFLSEETEIKSSLQSNEVLTLKLQN